jgi:hypothetical protein
MFKQQCKCKSILNAKLALSLSQLRLVPKVGQWGQLKFQGWFIIKVLQINQFKLLKDPRLLSLTKRILNVTNYYTIYKDTQDTKVQEV